VRAYDCERVHEGLGGLLVPADRYVGRSEEVLAQIERSRRGGAALARRTRAGAVPRGLARRATRLVGERVWPGRASNREAVRRDPCTRAALEDACARFG
jgi:hypothetical protein